MPSTLKSSVRFDSKKWFQGLIEKYKNDKATPWYLGGTLFLAILIWGTYGPIIHGSFAADEWWALAFAIRTRNLHELLAPAGIFAPAANVFIYVLYQLFHTNAHAWGAIALLVHLANTYLIFWLVSRLTKSGWIGFFTAALFAFLPMGDQFVDQTSLMPTSGMATLCALSSLVAYSYRKVIPAALLLLLSYLFSAYVVPFIFFTYMVEAVLFQKKFWKRTLAHLAVMTVVFLGYYYELNRISLSSGTLYDRPSDHLSLVQRLTPMFMKTFQGYAELVIHRLGLISEPDMLALSTKIVVVSLVLIGLLLVRKQFLLAKTAIMGLLWVPASLFLFSSLTTVAPNVTFPSRYFYVTVVGAGLLVGSIIVGLTADWSVGFIKKLHLPVLGLSAALLAALMIYLPTTQSEVMIEVHTGMAKQLVMDSLVKSVPVGSLGRDALFCFSSNTGHFGTGPELIPMPFIINFAFPLGVTYRANEPTMREFFTHNDYFVNPTASWYFHGHPEGQPTFVSPGIGYAANINACKTVLSLNSYIKPEGVYGFVYDGEKPSLTNVSDSLRKFLAGDTSAEAALYPWRHDLPR